MTKIAALPGPEPDAFHGVPTLSIHVDEPIPALRAPQRYAVRVSPDLARYLLTFNHPDNRRLRDRKVRAMASDMASGRWQFTPESIVFTVSGVLVNGQNRLMAVTETGEPIWLMLDFGWPDDIITVIDRGSARTNHDTMKVSGLANSSDLSAIVTKVWQYDRTVSQTRSWSGLPTPTSAEALGIVMADPESWQDAAHAARRMYRALDKGGSISSWGSAYYIIGREHPDKIERFCDEIVIGTGRPGSASRVLADWFRRRPDSATRTGDNREPVELIIRGFNGWLADKSFPFAKFKGFPLSRVKSA